MPDTLPQTATLTHAGTYVDLTFPAFGELIPMDHGYALYGALARHTSWLHGDDAKAERVGVFPIRGTPGDRTLRLGPHAGQPRRPRDPRQKPDPRRLRGAHRRPDGGRIHPPAGARPWRPPEDGLRPLPARRGRAVTADLLAKSAAPGKTACTLVRHASDVLNAFDALFGGEASLTPAWLTFFRVEPGHLPLPDARHGDRALARLPARRRHGRP